MTGFKRFIGDYSNSHENSPKRAKVNSPPPPLPEPGRHPSYPPPLPGHGNYQTISKLPPAM